MMRFWSVLMLVLVLSLHRSVAIEQPEQPAPIATLIQRAELRDGVHLVYLVESAAPITIGGTLRSYSQSAERDPASGRWRTTVRAWLDACAGSLLINAQPLVQQRCIWHPIVIHTY